MPQPPHTRVRSLAHRLAMCSIGALIGHSAQAAPQLIQVNKADGSGVPQAAVSVYIKGGKANAPPGTSADMGQRDKSFVPALRVIQTGTLLNFPNFDTVRHHVYSFSPVRTFEIKLYAGTPAAPVLFDKPGTATLGCNIHDRMVGHVHVVDTPHFGVTDAQGRLSLDLPAGEHRVRVWTPAMGETSPGSEHTLKTSASAAVLQLKP